MRTLCIVIGIILFSLSVSLTVQAEPIGPPVKVLYGVETFAQTFIEGTKIRVSLSRDGKTWSDAGFPVVNLVESQGVGVCGSWNGKKIVIVYSSNRVFFVVPGSVNDMSVSWGSPLLISFGSYSAPTCSFLSDNLLLVASRQDNRMLVFFYNVAGNTVMPTLPTLFNSNSIGRPSLATIGDVTIMAWQQYIEDSRRCPEVILAEGRMMTQGFFTFSFEPLPTPERVAPLLLTDDTQVSACAVNDPVLATDGKYFYLAVIQGAKGAPLHMGSVVLYRSKGADLHSGWAEYGRIPFKVDDQTFVNLAVNEAGNMVVAKNQELRVNILGAELNSGGSWQDLGVAPWIGASGENVPHLQFGLTRFGFNNPWKVPTGLKMTPK